jgi:ATP diphosphatase
METDKNQANESAAEKFQRLLEIVRDLRHRCAWDREQTLATMAKGLIEESYEVLDAVERDAAGELTGELGDVLVQVLFGAVIAAENDGGGIESIMDAAIGKLIRRHPHVYGDATANDAAEAVANWEKIKQAERAESGYRSALDGIATTLPALVRAEKLGRRAREAGVDWRDLRAVIAKVREELDEVEAAIDSGSAADTAGEIGDALLALANAPRFLDASAEDVLRAASAKFVKRFQRLEDLARSRSINLREIDDAQIDDLWREAKRSLQEK